MRHRAEQIARRDARAMERSHAAAAAQLDARRVARTTVGARRTAAASRRVGALLAFHWGLHTWRETLRAISEEEEARRRPHAECV